jgi:hypothetical protein
MVRRDKARIFWSLRYKIKAVINDGLLGGCLKRFSGSGLSQHSSSQSTGQSKSKLVDHVNKNSREHKGSYSSS